jgi:hypothetical protein
MWGSRLGRADRHDRQGAEADLPGPTISINDDQAVIVTGAHSRIVRSV